MLKRIGALLGSTSAAVLMSLAQLEPGVALAASNGPIVYNEPNQYGGQDVWLMNPDGSGNRRLPIAPNLVVSAEAPVWSRDGSHIAVTGLLNTPAGMNPAKILVVFDPAATDVRGFFPPTSIYNIYKAFFPDGKRVTYSSFALNFVDFGIRSVDGKENTYLGFRDNTQGTSGLGIDWSPRDANLLVASLAGIDTSFTPRPVTKLFRVPAVANGLSQAVPLTNPAPPSPFVDIYDLYPAFTPDGSRVAYVRYIIDASNLFGPQVTKSQVRIVNVDGSNDHLVLELPEELVNSLQWSGDASQLLMDRVSSPAGVPMPGGNRGVWVLNAGGLHGVLAAPASNPAWSWAPLRSFAPTLAAAASSVQGVPSVVGSAAPTTASAKSPVSSMSAAQALLGRRP